MKKRLKRHQRIRGKITGSAARPRVSVFRSLKHFYLQAIDDQKSQTIASSSSLKNNDLAGELARQLKSKKITEIVFDRSGYQYHGKIKKMAEDLRQAGLEF